MKRLPRIFPKPDFFWYFFLITINEIKYFITLMKRLPRIFPKIEPEFIFIDLRFVFYKWLIIFFKSFYYILIIFSHLFTLLVFHFFLTLLWNEYIDKYYLMIYLLEYHIIQRWHENHKDDRELYNLYARRRVLNWYQYNIYNRKPENIF
jgi:hypothetical protein